MDHPNGSVVPVPIEWEFKVLDCLQRTAVPAARPFWYEDDESLIGRAPFYVRDNVPGTASFRDLYAEGAEERRAAIGRQFAELLAAVHTADWEAAGFAEFMAVPKTPEECALLELRRYRRHYDAHRSEPKPVMAELLSWLERNAPTSVPRVSLVWGDVGLGNFIFDAGRIVALTDWEQAHLGDPMKDWASALWRGMDSLLPREELFRVYEDASGIPVDLDAVRYYHAFIDAQYVMTSHPLISELLDGRFDDVTFARLGLGVPFFCLDDGFRIVTA
jgi:aminoglycoside phosphotransferase (APT) family kinase protein